MTGNAPEDSHMSTIAGGGLFNTRRHLPEVCTNH